MLELPEQSVKEIPGEVVLMDLRILEVEVAGLEAMVQTVPFFPVLTVEMEVLELLLQ
jgi:hypothetical protein